MMEKMMDPNLIDYYPIDCAISSKIGIKNGYEIDFSNHIKGLVAFKPWVGLVEGLR